MRLGSIFRKNRRPYIYFFLVLCLCFFSIFTFSGCSSNAADDDSVLVYIVEGEHFTVARNGLRISPGKNATFAIKTAQNYTVTGISYQGEHRITSNGNNVTLELFDIKYPTQIELKLTSSFRTIKYDANGGSPVNGGSSPIQISYDISLHKRPNTSNGYSLFERQGYTMTGWNTKPDGSGTHVGLGSRVSVDDNGLTLYAQWEKWTAPESFSYENTENGLRLTGCSSSDRILVIPQTINNIPVVSIGSNVFTEKNNAERIVLSPYLHNLENESFKNCPLSELVIFDSLEVFGDSSFINCPNLKTLYVNAYEAPFCYEYRKECVYADKVDMLINAQGKKKMVFYAGCSVWYNLDSESIINNFGDEYQIINMGLNGTVSSWVQMAILTPFLEEGDLFIHTPELSSKTQLMEQIDMGDTDYLLWCGLETNYDLFSLVDISCINGVFDSLNTYLSKKNKETTYASERLSPEGEPYIDEIGSIPFKRELTKENLYDSVTLDPEHLKNTSYDNLRQSYQSLIDKGIHVYVSCAIINIDAVPEEQKNNIGAVNDAFNEIISAMNGPVMISNLWNFIYHSDDCYDTNYHLRTSQAKQNTDIWIYDIKKQFEKENKHITY